MGTPDITDRPWLLLPGTLCTGAVFDGFLDALGVKPDQRHYIPVDRPAIADYLADFDDLTPDTIVCGFSLGAIIAAHAADRMSAHSLILFGVNPFADDPAKAEGRLALARDVTAHGGAAALQTRALDLAGPQQSEARRHIYAMADQSAHLIDAQTQLALTRPGALPALARATLPVLALTGSRDSAAPPAKGLAAAQAAPSGRFHSLEGLGHFALLENPQACALAVTAMMAQTGPSQEPIRK